MTRAAAWWGEWGFEPGETRYWRIGPLQLWIEFRGREWVIRRSRGVDPLDMGLEIATDRPISLDGSMKLDVDRVVGEHSKARIRLSPRLADRTIVVRPDNPFHILEGCGVSLYVSSPIWISIELADSESQPLLEIPIVRPSDTWFGPSTLAGQAAYAMGTSCRVDPSDLPVRPHRATTRLEIKHPGSGKMTFERLAVPVQTLSLYQDADDRLWTESLLVHYRAAAAGLADIEKRAGMPEEARGAERISSSRVEHPEGLFRVFDELF